LRIVTGVVSAATWRKESQMSSPNIAATPDRQAAFAPGPTSTQVAAVHPAAGAFPLMSPDELRQLADDIATNGLVHPIVRNAVGVILDGRNRLRACEIAGIEPRYEQFKGTDATAFIVSTNLVRRHLSESQRAMVAAKLAELSKHGGDRRSEQAAANLPLEMKRSVASALMNVSERSIGHAAVIRKHGTPELIRDVEAGKISVSAAAKKAQPPKPKPQPKPKSKSKPQPEKPMICVARIKSAFAHVEKAAADGNAKLFQKELRELIEAAKEQLK
jgi:hypothetical protein